MLFRIISVAALWALAAGSASAALISFTDRAAFLADTSGHIFSTPGSTSFAFVESVQVNNILITADRSVQPTNIVGSLDFTTALAGQEIALNYESFTMQSVDGFAAPVPVFGMGFDVVEATTGGDGPGTCDVSTCVQSTFEIEVFAGTTLLETFTFEPADDQLAFFGVAGNMAFDRFQVREIVGTNDDEYFGNFITASAYSPTQVPLPASALMLGLAVAGFGAVARRRR